MPVRQFLEKTLQGDVRAMISECTLAAATRTDKNDAAGKEKKEATRRPEYLPPPTELPLRYCKHEAQREEAHEKGKRWTEAECLADLLGGMARGGETQKNKWHYVLATADGEDESSRKKPTGPDLRERARMIPGVPIVYVKRSVMILEEMSAASERWIRRKEKEKLREGILGKRKRVTDGLEDSETEEQNDMQRERTRAINGGTRRGMRKAKGPNPLSVKKKKVRMPREERTEKVNMGEEPIPKAKRRRKHASKKAAAIDGSEPGIDA